MHQPHIRHVTCGLSDRIVCFQHDLGPDGEIARMTRPIRSGAHRLERDLFAFLERDHLRPRRGHRPGGGFHEFRADLRANATTVKTQEGDVHLQVLCEAPGAAEIR